MNSADGVEVLAEGYSAHTLLITDKPRYKLSEFLEGTHGPEGELLVTSDLFTFTRSHQLSTSAQNPLQKSTVGYGFNLHFSDHY